MNEEDFMHTIEIGDYKYIFEYDTPEEFMKYSEETIKNHEKLMEIQSKYVHINKALDRAEKQPANKLTFHDLEGKFINKKKELGKVSDSTYKAYASTFNKLKTFFNKTLIANIELDDYEDFRDYLSQEQELKNKTINNHMIYVNQFLKFAKTRKLITENNVEGLESLPEEEVFKENFTNEDIYNIMNHDYEQEYRDIFMIGMYTGMRIGEILNIGKDNFIRHEEESDIYYIEILKSKTKQGKRDIPIHKDILKRVLDIDFPILGDKSKNAANKAILKALYKVIDKESTKSFHTFRGTFVEKAMNNFPERLHIVQEIIGHSKGESKKLTTETYGKGYYLTIKKEIVDSVSYF